MIFFKRLGRPKTLSLVQGLQTANRKDSVRQNVSVHKFNLVISLLLVFPGAKRFTPEVSRLGFGHGLVSFTPHCNDRHSLCGFWRDLSTGLSLFWPFPSCGNGYLEFPNPKYYSRLQQFFHGGSIYQTATCSHGNLSPSNCPRLGISLPYWHGIGNRIKPLVFRLARDSSFFVHNPQYYFDLFIWLVYFQYFRACNRIFPRHQAPLRSGPSNSVLHHPSDVSPFCFGREKNWHSFEIQSPFAIP